MNRELMGCPQTPDHFQRTGWANAYRLHGAAVTAFYTLSRASWIKRDKLAEYAGRMEVRSVVHSAAYWVLALTGVSCATGGGIFWGYPAGLGRR